MKNKLLFLILCLTFLSCGKDEDAIDCAAEALLAITNREVSAEDPRKIDFSVISSGTVQYVAWNFGDGVATVGGTEISHTYTQAGTYHVNLTVYLSKGCSYNKSITATVE